MVQTVNMQSDGSFTINFGNVNVSGSTNDEFLPAQLLVKTRDIHDTINGAGISEIHIENDTFQSFEHARTGSDVNVYDFGTHVTEEEFNALMALSEMFD